MNQEPRKKPYAFRSSTETLRQFKDAPPEAKLNWLEEANRFVNDFGSEFICVADWLQKTHATIL
jgi:hypothetical protein